MSGSEKCATCGGSVYYDLAAHHGDYIVAVFRCTRAPSTHEGAFRRFVPADAPADQPTCAECSGTGWKIGGVICQCNPMHPDRVDDHQSFPTNNDVAMLLRKPPADQPCRREHDPANVDHKCCTPAADQPTHEHGPWCEYDGNGKAVDRSPYCTPAADERTDTQGEGFCYSRVQPHVWRNGWCIVDGHQLAAPAASPSAGKEGPHSWTDVWHGEDAPDWSTWTREAIADYFFNEGTRYSPRNVRAASPSADTREDEAAFQRMLREMPTNERSVKAVFRWALSYARGGKR